MAAGDIEGSRPMAATWGFCVLRMDCKFWSGTDWVDHWWDALFFNGLPDPWQACHDLVETLREQGDRCSVAYVPMGRMIPKRYQRQGG